MFVICLCMSESQFPDGKMRIAISTSQVHVFFSLNNYMKNVPIFSLVISHGKLGIHSIAQ